MFLRLRLVIVAVALHGAAWSQPLPTPESHFGHRMGADRQLVEWSEVVRYFRRLDDASPNLTVEQLGLSTEGRPLIMAVVSDAATLRNLDRYRSTQARLADPRRTPAAEAETLIRQGKTVVMITCSVHSTEVASTLSAIEFAYRLLAEPTRRHETILRETVFLLIPSLNPDGVDKVAAWYKRYLGTPYEGAPMIELYHKYVGHDNNRDWYIFSQPETRAVVENAHDVWRPQIVYDVHQMGPNGARIFLPPWIDPVDPNIDPLIVQQVNKMGMAMAADLTSAGKTGVLVNGIYDYFSPARHYQSYHGGLRLLSESASVRFATPIRVPFSTLDRRGRGYNAQQASWNFPEPWPGGEWKLRDIVDYQLIAFESCLYQAAINREDLLRNFYRIHRRVIERGGTKTFIIPRSQQDPGALVRLLRALSFGDVEIEQARGPFRATGRDFAAGDYVIRLAQPFGSFAKTLLEAQHYPDLRVYAGGPPRPPYDVTAHALPLLMGTQVFPTDETPDVQLDVIDEVLPEPGSVASSRTVAWSSEHSDAWRVVNELLAAGVPVYRNEVEGIFYVSPTEEIQPRLEELADDLGIKFLATAANPTQHRLLRQPRIGIYSGFVPIMDEGWTRWMLEQAGFPHARIDNQRVKLGNLARDFDVVILPDAPPQTLQAGYIPGALYGGVPAPPEYTGGIEARGAAALRQFVEQGGTLLAFNEASSWAIERLNLAVRNAVADRSSEEFYAPGSLLNAQVETAHPLCFGMKPREAVWFESGPVFAQPRNAVGSRVVNVVRYPDRDVLAAGWLLGEQHIRGQAAVADVSLGEGHVVLFGIRPQYRGQAYATFKMVYNGLFYW